MERELAEDTALRVVSETIATPNVFSSDTLLDEDLQMDSLDLVTICMEVEKETGCDFPSGEVHAMKTVDDFINLIEKHA